MTTTSTTTAKNGARLITLVASPTNLSNGSSPSFFSRLSAASLRSMSGI